MKRPSDDEEGSEKNKLIRGEDFVVPSNFSDDTLENEDIPNNFFDEGRSELSQLFEDYPLPSPISTQMLKGSDQASGPCFQCGFGNEDIPNNFFDEDFEEGRSDLSQLFEDYPLPSPISTQMLKGSDQTSSSCFQRGFGINEGAGPSNAPDFLAAPDQFDSLNIESAISLVEKRRRLIEKFDAVEIIYNAIVHQDKLPDHFWGVSLGHIIGLVKAIFQKIIDSATAGMDAKDYIRICVFHNRLDKPISIGKLEIGSLTVENIMSQIMKVIQSKEDIALDEGFSVDVVVIRRPRGGARRKINIADVDGLKKRSIVSISEDEYGVCCAKAILLALAFVNRDPEIEALRKPKHTVLLRRALALHEATNIPVGPCGLSEIEKFERHLKVQVVVISTSALNKIIYKGSHRSKKVYIWLNGNHFDVIRSPRGFYGSRNYCQHCEKPFNMVADHRCDVLCHICRTADCTAGVEQRCTDCDRKCRSALCFDIHKQRGICNEIYQCRNCCKVILRRLCPKENHRCGQVFCPSCKKCVPNNHLCFMQKIKAKVPNEKILYFDFETDQSSDEHIVNFAVVQYFDGSERVFEGYAALDTFCRFLFSQQHVGFTAIAHNMKGFDGQFILQWLLGQGQTPDVIPNGSKLMSIFSKPFNIRIIDSFNFLPMSLSKLPKTFGIEELKKGFFPHLFNRPENQNFIGAVPAENFYCPDFMNTTERERFYQWYRVRVTEPFDFKQEMLDYCRSDVDILRRCCNQFRQQFLEITNVDPFCYVTIAASCMAYFRSIHIQLETIATIPTNGYVNNTNYSMDSIRWLDFVAESESVHIQHALNGRGEIKVGGKTVDGFCSQTNTIYQFHGCFYHGCEYCYDADVRNPVKGCKMGDLFQRTTESSEEIRRKGFNLVEIWEHEFRKLKRENADLTAFLDNHDICDRLDPRDSFFGGRTNAVQLFFQGEAKYIDFTSLYPWVNKYCRYPVGHPTIITKDFSDLEDYFGVIKCRVLPPRGLFHPALPYRSNGKLMFPLCRSCVEMLSQESCTHTDNQRAFTGTWITEEVKKAKEMGYKILKIYEVYHFNSSSSKLFQPYIDVFLKIKQEASGWPTECTTDLAKKTYVEKYVAKEGVHLNPENIILNPGRRSVAKLSLNSFWGRFGMRCNKDKLSFVSSVAEFNKFLMDKTKEIKDITFPSSEIAAITWRQKDDFATGDTVTNIFIASFTTCYARLKLYGVLQELGKDVLYFDTDSVIYKTDGKNDPELGNFLGDFTDELDGDIIQTFVSGGPKNYAYKTTSGSTVCKIRGFSLNFKNAELLNLKSMQHLIQSMDNRKIEVSNPRKITRDATTRKVINKFETKGYRIVYDKRVIQDDLSTLPYGY